MAKATCKIEDCDGPVAGHGWCSMHYQRWQNNGDPLIVKRRAKQAAVCELDDCDEPGYMRGRCLRHYREVQKAERGECSEADCHEPWQSRGLCSKHYSRFMRTGSTDDPKPVHRPCSEPDCDSQVVAKELCGKHYRNLCRYGTPKGRPKPEKVWAQCSEPDCDQLAARRNGMCDPHYRKAVAGGKPKCREPGCGRPVRMLGSNCSVHGGWSQDLRRTYGISAEQFEAMKAAQGGRCKICGKLPEEFTTRIKRLVVDHDHACCPGTKSCGKCVRGLLCNWCNRLLGMALDDPERLRGAIRYLEETKPGQMALFAA